MPGPRQDTLRNQLLTSLSAKDYALIQPHLVPVDLVRGAVLIEPDQPIPSAWFPDSGIGSIVALSPEGHKSEVGIFGRDGMAASGLVLGVDRTPHQTIIQVAGQGHRLAAEELRNACGQSASLRNLLLRNAHALFVQTSFTALSNATHVIEERLARWLLMCHDRNEGDEISLTHEFLALMLSVRRPGVTTALHVLEGMRLIRASRGLVAIRDRAGLEELAADAYGKPEAEYERIIGPLRPPSPRGGGLAT